MGDYTIRRLWPYSAVLSPATKFDRYYEIY